MTEMQKAAAAVGIPYRTVARWARQGLIQVDGHPMRPRTPVPWTEKHTSELRTLATLKAARLSTQALREAADTLKRMGHNPFSTGRFAVIGGQGKNRRLVKVCNEHEAIDLSRKHRGQGYLFIPVD